MPYWTINPITGKREYVDDRGNVTQAPQQGMSVEQPAFQASSEQVTEPKRTGFLGFADKAAEFLAPRTKKVLTKVNAAFGKEGFANKLPGLEKKREENAARAETLIKQSKAIRDTDPKKATELIKEANRLTGEVVEDHRALDLEFEKKTGGKIGDKDNVIREAIGVAGEVGTFLIPAGKLASGAKATQRILQGAKLGALVGGIHGATDSETESVREAIEQTLVEGGTGFLVGGAVSGAFEVPRAMVKKFLGAGGGNKRAIDRLFHMSPSARAKFRKSTGGMDFAEEILTRDGRQISGMSHEQMMSYFSDRVGKAVQHGDDLLAQSDKTINRKTVLAALNKQVKALAPEKGNVGTSGTINQLKGVIEDLSKLPDDNIPVAMANTLKRQLQDAGSAAFSPSGKATVTSKAMAGASSVFKEAIEEAVPDAKDANKAIQLYQAARSAIEKTGDREAVKYSNTFMQKFMQMLPAMGAGAAGIVGFGAGGIPGGVGGLALATVLLGGAGAARVKYLSPQVQSRMIASFTKVLNNQKVKGADAIASRIVSEISKQVSRGATLDSPGIESTEPPGETGDLLFQGGESAVNPVVQSQQPFGQPQPTQPAAVQQQQQSVPAQQPQQGIQPQHTQSVSDTVTIRNGKTGEVKQVSRSELGQYGLAPDSEESLPGLPSKNEILAAMVIDAQSGGKNISKLNTLLGAYDKVTGGEELSAAQKKRLVALEQAQTTIDLVEDLALSAGTGVGAYAKSKFGKLPGVEGGAEEDLDRITDGLARAIAGTLAGEVGIATDRDIIRWKGLMPKVTDTMEERQRSLQRLREALNNERQRLNVPDGTPQNAALGFSGGQSAF